MCFSGEYTIDEIKKKIVGKGDSIILTCGIAYGKNITNQIVESVDFIAPVTIYPGEDELLALAEGRLRVLKGEEKAQDYK